MEHPNTQQESDFFLFFFSLLLVLLSLFYLSLTPAALPSMPIKKKKQSDLPVLQIATLICQWYQKQFLVKIPVRTSALNGWEWTQEILNGHPRRFLEVCRMEKEVFFSLKTALSTIISPTKMPLDQVLMIFLFIVGHSATNRDAQERFQLSGETIHRQFHIALDGLCRLQSRALKMPGLNPAVPIEISNNSKFYPFFKDCVGAIDGTHIPVSVPAAAAGPFRNRKGFLSHNVLAACGFDMAFHYILAGWEGSAHDGMVLKAALGQDFRVPQGKYYLADAGYGNAPNFLVPYRGVRYHLKEWSRSNSRYV